MAQLVKNLPTMWETWIRFLAWKSPWSGAWQPTPIFLPGESPWTEKPGGLYSPWSRKQSDMTERLSTAHSINYMRDSALYYKIYFVLDNFAHLQAIENTVSTLKVG